MPTQIRFGNVLIGYGTTFAPTITRGDQGTTQTFSGSVDNPFGDKQITISFTYVDAYVDTTDNKSDSSQVITEALLTSLDGEKQTLTLVETQGDNGISNRQVFQDARVTSFAPSSTAGQTKTIAVQMTAKDANITYS